MRLIVVAKEADLDEFSEEVETNIEAGCHEDWFPKRAGLLKKMVA